MNDAYSVERKQSYGRLALRCILFAAGLLVNSFGVAFITKSALGTSQISSIPYVLSLYFSGISFGMFTFFLNVVFILIQIVLLKKDFHPIQFLQVLANILFSAFIDISMVFLGKFNPQVIGTKAVSLTAGCCILAFGISLEVAPHVIVVPGEGVVSAIAKVTNCRFGSVKMCFDITLIVIAGICSLLLFGELKGVGIGTVVSALLVGRIVNFVNSRVPIIKKIQEL